MGQEVTRFKSTKRERAKINKGLTNGKNSPWVGKALRSLAFASIYLNMRRKHGNEFTNGGFNEFQKQTGNILNLVETFATFDALDNVLSGYGPGCDAPSVGAPLSSCYSRITGLYLDVFRKCSEFCVINRTEDAQLYLDVYRKYSRVSGKVPCVQQGTGLRGSSAFVGGVGDGLDKRKLQTSGNSDVFEAYLALCSSGAGSRRSRSLSQTTPVSNSNLVHTDFSSVCGPSASLPGRSFHAYPNAVMITADSQHSYPVSRDGGNTQENCQLRSTIGVNNNGSSASRRDRNLQVRPRLNSAVGMRSTSRRTRRRVLTSGSTVDSNSVASAGTSYTYSDLGDCDRRCRYCGASFWYVERLKRHSHNQTPEYHLCCGGGRIQMQPPRKPPEYIKILFQNKNFMENIRAYNQMFAMTSFGAKIDESIKAGRGPYLYIYDTDNELQNRMHHFRGIDNNQLEPGIVEGLIHFLDAHNELVQLYRTARDKCRELDIPKFKIRLYNAEGARGYELPTLNTLGAIGKKADDACLLQYVVGVFCAVEQNRLDYIRKKQNDIRSDYLSGLYDAISRGERDGYEVGGRIILPMSFTGGPRYMYAHYLDALAIYRKLGNPQFFITFTCNVNWPEIKRFMSKYPHLTASDRADVVCRVFEQKIQALIAFLKEERIFGDVTGVIYTVEFQKRGLPHCHTLLWVDSASKIRIAEDVDRFISADLPDPRIDPEGYNVVLELMVHGPCGAPSLKAACMKDNSYVVPYNRDLLLAFRAHINVEYCGWSMLIKYPFKYISKGTDRVFARVSRPIGESSTVATPSRQVIDEIQNYVEGRFICAYEAYWRILKFDIHRREPAVQILAVHLEDMQRITFRDQDRLKLVIDLPRKKSTTLTEWFAFNEANEVGRHLLYLEFPSEFVWYSDRKSWSPRKTSKSSIGRLAYVHPTSELRAKHWVYSVMTRNRRLHLRRHGYTLYEIEIILSNCGKSLHAFGLPPPPQDLLAQLANRLLMEERNYNREELAQLKDESSYLFMAMVELEKHFSGKPSLVAYVLKERLYWQSHPQLGKLLADTDLIIWDEAPMNDHRCFEALDRSLRDIVDKPSSLFGGKSLLLGGDFRQTLPVKNGASKIEVISSCISESALWPSFKVLTLKHNMRLARPDISLEERSLCLSDESLVIPLEELHVDDKLHFVEEPVEVMDSEIKQLKRSRIPILKVRWNSKRGPEFTREREDQFKLMVLKRLDYKRKKQNDIRSDYLSGLYDAISRGEPDGYEVGGRIILPMSFTGEIKRFMFEYPHLTASDRADVVCRVFEQKIQALIAFLKEERIFGDVTGVLYTVEFQKRGLPHCHTLLWVDSASRIRIAEDADRFISAELPDPRIDPEGYNVVSELMVYGPCIAASVKAPCMKGDKRDTSVSTTRNEFQLDNSYVVPYNCNLLLAFRTHINVEYCGWSMLINYLFKYISKGTDKVFTRMSRRIGESSTVATPSRQVIDEIQNYVEGRFICAHEAYWRILKFDIHRREPIVHILAMHLEDMQRITFRDQDRLKSVIDLPRKKSTTLTEWFAFNEANEVGRHLSYLEFPSEFMWYSDRKSWSSRKTSKSFIGRLAYVHPTSGELFFLRMLLCHKKGCRDFWEVQTINGVFYLTYRAACQALSLLGDDKEWDIAFEDACGSATPEELQFLFSHILLHCDMADPSRLWRKYWNITICNFHQCKYPSIKLDAM
ncbi:DNA helicase [Tanacetum coccineum]